VLAATLAAASVLTGCAASAPAQQPPRSSKAAASRSTDPSRSPATSSRPSTPSPAQARAAAEQRVSALIGSHPADAVSVAALDLTNGRRFTAGGRAGLWTASAYKLLVLEALLLSRQSPGSTGLSSYEIGSATEMIENSDNPTGYQLFEDAGGNAALTATAQRLGMTHTVPGVSDPTFTTTSGADCLLLLRALVDPHGALNAASRSFALNLMANVEADQRWGVSVVADPGTTVYVKNGWLSVDNTNGPDEDDDGLWAVTSLGIVRCKGDQVLMAVLTRHNASFGGGVALVEQLSKPLAGSVTG
jgi:beta-lactamase class A